MNKTLSHFLKLKINVFEEYHQEKVSSLTKYRNHYFSVVVLKLQSLDQVPRASPGHWLDMHILGPHPKSLEAETPGVGSSKSGFYKPSGQFTCVLFEKH